MASFCQTLQFFTPRNLELKISRTNVDVRENIVPLYMSLYMLLRTISSYIARVLACSRFLTLVPSQFFRSPFVTQSRISRCSPMYGAFILSKSNITNRESSFQNDHHSSNSINKPFLNRMPFSRNRWVNSIGYFSN